MKRAILIGFEYDNNYKLPGIIIDLYIVYRFLKNIGFKDDQIDILSDITRDLKTDILRAAILEEIVNSDILSFINDCKNKNIYSIYNSKGYYNNFETLFKKESDYLFIYYTGHSKNGNIILPNNSLYSFDLFKNLFSDRKESLVILDCCESTGLNLPFLLIDNVYRLETEIFLKSKIICISSSLSYQDSIASKTGSFFTRYLFQLLKHKEKSLPEILQDINFILKKMNKEYGAKQTVNIFATYSHLKYIFGWIYQGSNINILYDESNKCLEIFY